MQDHDPAQRLLEEAGHRKVRALARTDSDLSRILFDLAAGNRRYWDLQSWGALLRRLDTSDLKVADWLRERGHV